MYVSSSDITVMVHVREHCLGYTIHQRISLWRFIGRTHYETIM